MWQHGQGPPSQSPGPVQGPPATRWVAPTSVARIHRLHHEVSCKCRMKKSLPDHFPGGLSDSGASCLLAEGAESMQGGRETGVQEPHWEHLRGSSLLLCMEGQTWKRKKGPLTNQITQHPNISRCSRTPQPKEPFIDSTYVSLSFSDIPFALNQ